MIIANPIYDVVFKRLMEDKRVASFFIETLLEETVVEVEVRPQEFTYTNQTMGLAVFRLDFLATIKTNTGEQKKILIEIQKAKNSIDLMRFRNYLGEQYKKEDEIPDGSGGTIKTSLPIVTIYLLGFRLAGIDSPALKVARQYTDLITHTIIKGYSEFIEKLTHDCYVVQLPRISGKVNTRLEQLLSIFEQDYFIDDKGTVKEYTHHIGDDTIRSMVNILHHTGTDPGRKKEIDDEREFWRTFEATAGDQYHVLLGKLEQKEKAIEEKERTIEENNKTIQYLLQELDEIKKNLKK